MRLPKFLLPKSGCPDEVPEGEKRLKGKKQLQQPSCRNCRGGKRREKKGIVTTKLQKLGPKIGGKKKRNCGSQVAEIEKEKNIKINLWQWNCRKWEEKKKNCGNGVAKNWRREREREQSG